MYKFLNSIKKKKTPSLIFSFAHRIHVYNTTYLGFLEKTLDEFIWILKPYHLKVNHIKAVVPYLLLFSEKKNFFFWSLFTKMHDVLSLGLEKKRFWEVTFISFLAFSFLASRYSPKTTLLDRSSISQELLCSPVCREVVILSVPMASAQNWSQMLLPLGRRWEAGSFRWSWWG